MDIITALDLDVGYDETAILRRLNFGIPEGRITAIVGESGSGKSTLLKTLIGLLPPLAGEIRLAGTPVDFRSERSLHGLFRRIGVLYQNSALLDSLTLYDNVALPIRMRDAGRPRAEEAAAVRTMLERVGLGEAGPKYPFELSGGMRKRAALARAMILAPDLLFCDEPSAGLDPITSSGLDDLLRGLAKDHGVTLVAVTHELRSIARIADRVMVLRGGAIYWAGEHADIARSDDPYLREFFLRKADHDH
jgi:phospholipid/cholesterol/gamma-HCH transport system ATP-binding protein